jgi:hypothetical protein
MSEVIPNLLDHLDIFLGHRDRIAISCVLSFIRRGNMTSCNRGSPQ